MRGGFDNHFRGTCQAGPHDQGDEEGGTDGHPSLDERGPHAEEPVGEAADCGPDDAGQR